MKQQLKKRFIAASKKYSNDNSNRFISRSIVRGVVWDKSNGRCWYCGKGTNPFAEFTVDHFIPGSSGGDNSFENLVPCCRFCNTSKGAKTIEQFRASLQKKPISVDSAFTDSQIKWLERNGIKLPLVVFAFEREDFGVYDNIGECVFS